MKIIKRKKIGILFSHNENWIGGTYYLLNLISSFNALEDNEKPQVIILSKNKSDFDVAKSTNYPYLDYLNFVIPYSFFQRIVFRFFPNYCKRTFKAYFSPKQFDTVFPYTYIEELKKIPNKVFWYPDFQEYYFPDFFTTKEIDSLKKMQNNVAKSKSVLVLSSDSALKDFMKFHPGYTCKPKVVNFAVTHPVYNHLDIETLRLKFGIDTEYFISPNQFWQHKNHITILKAVKLLKEQRKKVLVVFTGKEYDYRNPGYTDDLKRFVKEHDLETEILFLGFIDRTEQLQLMKHATAIIQPSLFEGWSTVVEDAKAMDQFLISSDIPVHKDQLKRNALFFSPTNEAELAERILTVNNSEIVKEANNYTINVKAFAQSFLSAIKK